MTTSILWIGRTKEETKMKNLKPDTNAMVVTEEYDIISHEKAYVRMEPGCVWVYLLEDDKRVGIAYVGPSKFAVDAIAETDMGAMGESVTDTLEGIKCSLVPLHWRTYPRRLRAQTFRLRDSMILLHSLRLLKHL